MITRDEIKAKLSNGNKNILDADIELLSNYFNSLLELNIIKDGNLLNELIDKVSNQLENIIYYDNTDKEILKELEISKNNKGTFKNGVLYINRNMTDEMIKITVFHELTHFLQRFHVDGMEECIGVMQNFKWRILMEAQTQNIAEIIYSHNYGNQKAIEEYKSEDLRMLPGGTIRSNLRNYQMYDSILKKLCLVLGMKIEEFMEINFYGIKAKEIFENRINNLYGKEVTNFINELLDIIYSTDAIIYTGNVQDLSDPYEVDSLIDGRKINASSKNQFICMQQFDKLMIYLSNDKIEVLSRLLDNQFIQEEKYLPQSDSFGEVSHASEEEVENNPEKYIMTECIPACKELWSKNIYTFMVSNYVGESGIWVEIYNEISAENLNYLKSLKEKNINVNVYHDGCYRIEVNHIGQAASDLLLEICKGFKIQDVPKNIAYFHEEDFLITCGCFDEIENPNYYEMKEFYELEFNTSEEMYSYMKKFSEWQHSENSKKYLKKYNPQKKIKSTEEYAKEKNMVFVNGVIFKSKFDYDKHIKYISNIKDEQNYLAHYENGVESVDRRF